MLQYRLKRYGVCYVLLLGVSFFCMTQYSNADDDLDEIHKNIQETLRSLGIPQSVESKNNQQHLTDAIHAFNKTLESDDEGIKELIKKWHEYIESASHYSNSDYLNAIDMQLANYYQAIADLGNIIKKNSSRNKKEYSSSWVDDLVSHFGIAFVKKNRDVILQCLQAILLTDESNFEHQLKDLIYAEAMLYGSYKDYLGMFLTFYKEELDQSAQKKIESRKILAENYLALIDKTSFTNMHDTTVLKKILSENKARKLNDEVFSFIKDHPLSHTFGDSRALKDFMKVVEK